MKCRYVNIVVTMALLVNSVAGDRDAVRRKILAKKLQSRINTDPDSMNGSSKRKLEEQGCCDSDCCQCYGGAGCCDPNNICYDYDRGPGKGPDGYCALQCEPDNLAPKKEEEEEEEEKEIILDPSSPPPADVAVVAVSMPTTVYKNSSALKKAAEAATTQAAGSDPDATAALVATAPGSVSLPADASEETKTAVLDSVQSLACDAVAVKDQCVASWDESGDGRRRLEEEASFEYIITFELDSADPTLPDFSTAITQTSLQTELNNNNPDMTVTIGEVETPEVDEVSVVIVVSVESALSDEEQEALLQAVADDAGIDISEFKIEQVTADNCAKLTTKAECKSKYAKQNNNCKWDKKEMICANPDPAFVQPVPLTACTGPCCKLNWRACTGKGAMAKAFERFEGLGKVKKACVYENDYSMTVSTPDGKYYGQCSPKTTEASEQDSEEDEDLRWEFAQECDDPCCNLDKRACKGKGAHATAFKRSYGASPKRVCKYLSDLTKTYQQDGSKNYGKCIPRDFEELTA